MRRAPEGPHRFLLEQGPGASLGYPSASTSLPMQTPQLLPGIGVFVGHVSLSGCMPGSRTGDLAGQKSR